MCLRQVRIEGQARAPGRDAWRRSKRAGTAHPGGGRYHRKRLVHAQAQQLSRSELLASHGAEEKCIFGMTVHAVSALEFGQSSIDWSPLHIICGAAVLRFRRLQLRLYVGREVVEAFKWDGLSSVKRYLLNWFWLGGSLGGYPAASCLSDALHGLVVALRFYRLNEVAEGSFLAHYNN